MPYLTPPSIPEETDCRSLLIPASPQWLALFGGALTTFLYAYNWEQTTGITVDETIAKMREIIDGFYDGCPQCTIPGGYRVVRINSVGKLEVLDNGEYVEPADGDYYIPPPEARTDGTPDDQICLAAKNAVNVLNILYESLSDSWAAELDTDAAILALITAFVAAVGFAIAPIVWAIAIPLIAFFGIVYRALAYLTADIWDVDFTDKLICLFVDCATNTDGVVTFDFLCIQDKLNALATDGGFNEVQARLNLQIGYILQFIGGIDALNLAARTTDITNDDCSFCDDCLVFDFRENDGGWVADTYGTWVAGEGWQLTPTPSAILVGYDGAPFPAHIASIEVEVYNSGGTGGLRMFYYSGGYVPITIAEAWGPGELTIAVYGGGDTGEVPNIWFNANCDNGSTCYLRKITICFL